jgi:hypothetical protein
VNDRLTRIIVSSHGNLHNGDMFDGTPEQFADCFFSNNDPLTIIHWAWSQGMSVAFEFEFDIEMETPKYSHHQPPSSV